METYEDVKKQYDKLISDIAVMSDSTEEEIREAMNNSSSIEEVLQKAMDYMNFKDEE